MHTLAEIAGLRAALAQNGVDLIAEARTIGSNAHACLRALAQAMIENVVPTPTPEDVDNFAAYILSTMMGNDLSLFLSMTAFSFPPPITAVGPLGAVVLPGGGGGGLNPQNGDPGTGISYA